MFELASMEEDRETLEEVFSDVNELKKVIKENVEDKWIDSLGVAVNGRLVKSLNEVKDGDVISLLPPVCGG